MELDNLFGAGPKDSTTKPEEPAVTKLPEATEEDDLHTVLHTKVMESMNGRLHSEIPLGDEYWKHLENLKQHLHSKKE